MELLTLSQRHYVTLIASKQFNIVLKWMMESWLHSTMRIGEHPDQDKASKEIIS